MDALTLCLDIGGSSVKCGIFDPLTFERQKTLLQILPNVEIGSNLFADVERAVVTAIQHAMSSADVSRLGISTTGTVRPDGVVHSAGHFIGYELVDWSVLLRRRFPSLQQVVVANDGKASAWAEFCNQGGGSRSHVHFVLGTGVGSSVVVHGRLVNGDSGDAGFLGHTLVTNEPTILCSCERQGCIETVASGPGLVNEYNKRASKPIEEFHEMVLLLAEGDSDALAVIDASATHFGSIIGVLANGLNPSAVTFGGGVILGLREGLRRSRSDEYFLDRVAERVRAVAFRRSGNNTRLAYGKFDNDGGLVGAALLASAVLPK